jgi:dimethylhistidine N-methyltransferase
MSVNPVNPNIFGTPGTHERVVLPARERSRERRLFLEEALQGLRRTPKELPCKYFYDETGSQLFDEICDLDEYYLTRTEKMIMSRHAGEMADALGPSCLVIEYGSGSSVKTRALLDRLVKAVGYVPVDISREHLYHAAADLAAEYPDLDVMPVVADFTKPFRLPKPARLPERKVVYFPGSTIGNLTPKETRSFLRSVRQVVGRSGALLIGVDLKKDRAILEAAYNDRRGVTARFNLNLLERMNRELKTDFQIDKFRHEAVYDAARSRIEMRLVSLEDQVVHLAGQEIGFRAGEFIRTEYSHKYGLEQFRRTARDAGFQVEKVWTDDAEMFSVQYLTVR